MGNGFKNKSEQELNVIIQTLPADSGLYQKASQELNRRNFWKKDIISWLSLIFGASALLLHLLKYIKG